MKALYRPEHVLGMLDAANEISQQQIAQGTHPGMQSLAKPVEVQEGHCINCGEKRQFVVEGEQEHDNGALRKFGTCPNCGTGLSRFTPGKNRKWGQDKPKAKKSG